MKDDCPTGITNGKNLEILSEKVALMFEHVNDGLEKMDKKIDQLDDKLEHLTQKLPEQIETIVEAKWKAGVYSVVKWIIGGIVAVLITIAVTYIFKQ